jgi:uncharacterized protein (TIGR00369 family)
MAGLDYVRAAMDGKIPHPPISSLLGFELVHIEQGKAVFTCTPDESVHNALGTVSGGIVCTMLDTAIGCAVHSTMPQGKGFTSLEIKVNFLKAVRPSSGALTATGTVIKSGSRAAFTEGTVIDGTGALVATASSTLLIIDFPAS